MSNSTDWREKTSDKASRALYWAQLVAHAGVIGAAFSGAFGAGPTGKWGVSIALPIIVVALKLAKVF